MHVEITPFLPASAPDQDLVQHHEIAVAVLAHDFPERPMPAYEYYVNTLRQPISIMGPRRFWVARADGRIVGFAIATFPKSENLELAITSVQVPPDLRRRGIGTALLRATLPAARQEGRTAVIAYGIKVGGDGVPWSESLGFTRMQEFVLQTLLVPDVDPRLWEIPAPVGFRAERWIGRAPDALVASFAEARTAITDAPVGDSTMEFPEWTVERVREHEAEFRERDSEQRIVVAVHEASGTVAGLTELEIRSGQAEVAYQLDTAVLPAYRGHGLGRFAKAAMMRWLLAERPETVRVATATASDNVHMIRVNHQIGYATDHVLADLQADTGALLALWPTTPDHSTISPH